VDNKTKILGIIAMLVLVVIAVIMGRKPGDPRPVRPDATPDAPLARAEKKGSGGKAQAAKALNKNTKQRRMEIEAKLGFSDVPVTVKGDTIKLAVDFAVETRCDWGDIDVMEKTLARAKKSKLLLTLEPLGERGAKPFGSQVITISQLRSGIKKEFEVPDSSALRPLGIFICLDAADAGSCAAKPNANMMHAFNDARRIAAHDGVGKAPSHSDRVFFFHALHAQDSSIQVIADTTMKAKNYDAIEKYYDGKLEQRVSANQAIGQARDTNERVMSVPPVITKSGLRLLLPAADRAKCPAGHLAAPPTREGTPKTPPAAPDMAKDQPASVWKMPAKDLDPPGWKK